MHANSSSLSTKRVLLMITTRAAHTRRVLEGIADYVEHHAHWQNILINQLDPRRVRRGDVDGIISEASNPAMARALSAARIPTITVAGTPIDRGPPAVIVDNRAVGRMAGEHFINLGLKHIAYVPWPGTHYSWQREEGLRMSLHARGLKLLRCPDLFFDHDKRILEWIKKLPEPLGLLAANDQLARRILDLCGSSGKKIPDQIALMGVDNEKDFCRLADPPLSSIDHGTRRIGYEAAHLLDGWMNTGRRPAQTTLVQPIGVVARQSTNLLAVANPHVVAALEFIRSHAGSALKTEDVLRHVTRSRRALEMHFQKLLGRTIHDEIIRVRMEHAKNLLISSDQSVLQIAGACGFLFPSQFSHAFKREVGMPPQEFRKQYRYR